MSPTPVDRGRLGAPLAFREGRSLSNRLMKSALSEGLAEPDGAPGARLEELYRRWSTGGYGLLVTGNVIVDHRHLGEPGNVVVEDDRHLAALTRWAAAYKANGGPIWAQLNHPGRQANQRTGRHRPVAPSAIAARVPGAAKPRALRDEEVRDIIGRFGTAAAVIEAAGFDGVQIHGAHGYLVTQFLSPLSNLRDDAWGGDPERRRAFVIEVFRAIRAGVAPGFGVGIKLNSADFQRGGFTEAESREVVRALVAEGVDLIEVSGGSYEAPAMMGVLAESTRAREAYFLDYARTVRDVAGEVPIAVTGGFRTRAAMERALADGDCDVIGIGRPACLTPDAGAALLDRGRDRLDAPAIRAGARALLGRLTDLRKVDSAVNLQWHADQLHRMAAGLDPDPALPWWRTLTSMLRRGPGALRPKRG
ncbi:2,4-dienoyl-CoA reductase-like NADH-dependent reductase (Old Yellow Enzyme family) [Actinocorallia herbida]|uniref:2,4-dienoyl-CoA reductase-like NADH-dependent reductase (Old Yellow Enzyme family) n=1 Tax=Actinocorallia herbida TaxID=58109 RepID=A0A3N1CZL8_9ACTN|nr:NADH:flavin oxidoreductase/NADH oxidase family protein [Actinocorallia herbida]ROO86733.1 2,4-dienoyl-CoA reductase-like NADH-dependent reductase (Old Yellow Enzyme family) [Actinocorallia herbida]